MSLPAWREDIAESALHGSGPFGSRPGAYRELNRQILRISEDWGVVAGPVVVYCECGLRNCSRELELTLAECEAVRSRPDCFVLGPGHNNPTTERIVETHANCVLAEPVERPSREFVEVAVTGASEWRHLGSLTERYGMRIYDEQPHSGPPDSTWVSVGVPRAQTREQAEQVVAELLEWILHEHHVPAATP